VSAHPIALTYPERAGSDRVQTNLAGLAPSHLKSLIWNGFRPEPGATGGGNRRTLPAVLNAANEVAVDAYVNRRISFPQITEIVQKPWTLIA